MIALFKEGSREFCGARSIEVVVVHKQEIVDCYSSLEPRLVGGGNESLVYTCVT